ncbi:ABC transporter permease [Shewanella sp. OPT22]|nr:ABC transporter permease [Shewanella sp. OPT22]
MFYWIDVKYAFRLLFKKPVFTLTAIMMVAIGLALTLFSYSLLMNLVFNPLTLNSDKPVIAIEEVFDDTHFSRAGADPIDFYRLRNESNTIAELGLYDERTTLISDIQPGSRTQKYNAALTEWNVFEFSGVQPILGRGFRESDQYTGAEPVVVLSHKVWQEYFKSEPTIVGKMIMVEAAPTKVIGVMPEAYAFPSHSQMWMPMPETLLKPTERSNYWLFGFARLKDTATLPQLQKELEVLSGKLIAEYGEEMFWRSSVAGGYLRAVPYKQANADVTEYYNVFLSLFAVVILILLLACINIGNLLLTRVNERAKEIAIRQALGVSQMRLIMQMLWESILICSVGGLVALALTVFGLDIANNALASLFEVNDRQPFWWHFSLSSDAILLLIITVVAMILITGLIPAYRAISSDFNAVLRDGTRGALGRNASRTSNILVISEITLSCVVLVIATVLLWTSYAASNADYGVETANRVTARIELPRETYRINYGQESEAADRQKITNFYYNLKRRLEHRADIEAVAFMTALPGTGEGVSHYEIEGKAAAVYNENPSANNESVVRGSWKAVGMKLVAGRDFDHRDIETVQGNVIINESIARDIFPNNDAIGQRIKRVWQGGGWEWQTIIGVVSDTFHGPTMRTSSAQYTMYRPVDRDGRSQISMAIHYLGREAEARKALLETVKQIDNGVGVYNLQSYANLIKEPMLLVSAVSKLFLFCGFVAMFLAASGIYAVASNNISQRTQEVGVRKALGATDSMVMSLFLNKALLQLVIGLFIGIGIAVWGISLMTHALVINSMSYLIGLGSMVLLIAFIVLLATYVPTKKATLMEPSNALHHD